MKTYYPSLNCYPTTNPELSGKLLSLLADSPDEWHKPGDINTQFPEYGCIRTRNELKNLIAHGFVRHRSGKGYQLAIPQGEARELFGYRESQTQARVIAEIIRNGSVYARKFWLSGGGDASQFLRAVRSLEEQGVIENTCVSVPTAPHIKRRIYTFTRRAKKQ
ncbi:MULTISPECIES: hypothetical protein [Enterobacteriaceae]|jgi:hypothetical protein|uniref:Uncharacterized protein n=2 Tax=Escherichia TaxID=561 RepID=A0A1C0Y1B3_ECOLX|nr:MULTISPECIES: hypothetical protein [Enterobacteriaceae]EFA4272486.1 hypothetical protein [Escherichia coli O8]EFF0783208.1 hypothetical protein [Escherichia albertii]EJL4255068.1 hypothetical protein [Shigella flexneri]DAH83388.1 MAG TPA: Transcriptional regulator [Caudoviricetes sp.]HAN3136922.1 hypothetical protein [Escherichia coli O25b:H4-ST131]